MRRLSRRAYPLPGKDHRRGTGVALTPSVDCVPTPARRREAGVTLFEMLTVLALLGLVSVIAVVPVNSYYQRSRLQSAAGDIRNFLQVAYTQAVNQHTQITVNLQQDATTGSWTLQLNPPPPPPLPGNGIATSGTYVLPSFVSLTYNPAATAGGWPSTTTGGVTVRSLACAPSGLTFIPAGATCGATETAGAAAQEVKTLSITHTSMVDGSLSPNTRFDIQIYPLWNVSYQKVLL